MAPLSRRGLALALAAASRARARNQLMARVARDDGHHTRARLLRALALSQEVQARRLLLILRGKIPGAGVEAELDELAAAYEQGAALAGEEGDQAGSRALEQCRQVTTRARELAGESEGPWHLCTVCGYLAPGPVPKRCPVCGAVPQRFRPLQ